LGIRVAARQWTRQQQPAAHPDPFRAAGNIAKRTEKKPSAPKRRRWVLAKLGPNDTIISLTVNLLLNGVSLTEAFGTLLISDWVISEAVA